MIKTARVRIRCRFTFHMVPDLMGWFGKILRLDAQRWCKRMSVSRGLQHQDLRQAANNIQVHGTDNWRNTPEEV